VDGDISRFLLEGSGLNHHLFFFHARQISMSAWELSLALEVTTVLDRA
jgi:hypothetical protein